MRILIWHDHGGWLDAFVRGTHDYLVPVSGTGDGGADGRDWPITELPPRLLRDSEVDVVILQRLEELDELERLTGLRAGRDVPAVFVEHNTPRVDVPNSRHPLRDRDDVVIVHVTHFNSLLWDCGTTPTAVIEHGVVDRGYRYTGELERFGVVINEPVRRWRVTGTDLLSEFTALAPVDVFGMKAEGLTDRVGTEAVVPRGDLRTEQLHDELALRRVYLHPMRWTSLGLSLLEAMHLGMPVIALDMTEVRRAVPPEAGVVSTSLDELRRGARLFLNEPDAARVAGLVARAFVREYYGLQRFLDDWDELLGGVVGGEVSTSSTTGGRSTTGGHSTTGRTA